MVVTEDGERGEKSLLRSVSRGDTCCLISDLIHDFQTLPKLLGGFTNLFSLFNHNAITWIYNTGHGLDCCCIIESLTAVQGAVYPRLFTPTKQAVLHYGGSHLSERRTRSCYERVCVCVRVCVWLKIMKR